MACVPQKWRRGRPHLRWLDCITGDTKRADMEDEDWTTVAWDRRQWRMEEGCKPGGDTIAVAILTSESGTYEEERDRGGREEDREGRERGRVRAGSEGRKEVEMLTLRYVSATLLALLLGRLPTALRVCPTVLRTVTGCLSKVCITVSTSLNSGPFIYHTSAVVHLSSKSQQCSIYIPDLNSGPFMFQNSTVVHLSFRPLHWSIYLSYLNSVPLIFHASTVVHLSCRPQWWSIYLSYRNDGPFIYQTSTVVHLSFRPYLAVGARHQRPCDRGQRLWEDFPSESPRRAVEYNLLRYSTHLTLSHVIYIPKGLCKVTKIPK